MRFALLLKDFNFLSVMDLYGTSCSDMTAFKSKAGAMSFAILMSSSIGENGTRKVDYDEAQKLFDFICQNVELPDVEKDYYSSLLSWATGLTASNLKKEGDTASE